MRRNVKKNSHRKKRVNKRDENEKRNKEKGRSS